MARKPKGTYSRTTGDWFSNDLCWAYASTGSSGVGITSALFNNDTVGRLLYVLTWQVYFGTNEQCYARMYQGHVGTAYDSARRVRPALGKPPGMPYFGQNVNLGPGDDTMSVYLISKQVDAFTFQPQHPICVIPPGYSFVTYVVAPTDGLACTWWYVVLTE